MSTEAKAMRRRSWFAIGLAMAAGALLIVLSVPRVAAYAALAGTGATVTALDQGKAVAPAALIAAHAAHDEALSWLPADARLRRDRARMA
ncbi:MAG: hypothetical protein KF899_13520, partial [Parvibaculum sp.]|nr:hypothetical protein [Parvibaculum sp.]